MPKVEYSGEFRGKRYEASLEIDQASINASNLRLFLRVEAQEAIAGQPARMTYLRGIIYPDLIAAVTEGAISIDGSPIPWPPDYETWCSLPEELGLAWEEAVYASNPSWRIGGEKKATTSTSGSSA